MYVYAIPSIHTGDGKFACSSCRRGMTFSSGSLTVECQNDRCAGVGKKVPVSEADALAIAEDLSRQAQAIAREVRHRMELRAAGIDREAIRAEMQAERRLAERAKAEGGAAA